MVNPGASGGELRHLSVAGRERNRLGLVGRELRDTATSRLIFPLAYDFCVGLLASFLGWSGSSWIREVVMGVSALGDPPAPLWLAPVFAGSLISGGLVSGLYERASFRSPRAPLAPSVLAAGLAVMGTVFVYQMLAFATLGRWVVLVTWAVATLFLAVPRMLLGTRGMRTPTRILFVGSEAHAELLKQRLGASEDHVFELVSVVIRGVSEAPRQDLLERCGDHAIELIVVEASSGTAVLEEAARCLTAGIRVQDLPTFLEVAFGEVLVESLRADWLSSTSAAQTPRLSRIGKRIFDVLVAGLLLVATLPFWPLLILGIRLGSRGSAFYSQDRVGRGGRIFRIYKFRTMVSDAEQEGRPVWAASQDARVTSLGRWLRRLRVDELPQLWNVLRGEMSFVGPRPERPEFVALLEEQIQGYGLRHLIKPGITGWAQVNYPYGASVEDARAKLRYDLYYVRHGGWLLDMRIVLRTVGALTWGAR